MQEERPVKDHQQAKHSRSYDENSTAPDSGAIRLRRTLFLFIHAGVTYFRERKEQTTDRPLSSIQRAAHTDSRLIKHVSVNHRRAYIFVAEQFLHCANIIAVL